MNYTATCMMKSHEQGLLQFDCHLVMQPVQGVLGLEARYILAHGDTMGIFVICYSIFLIYCLLLDNILQ